MLRFLSLTSVIEKCLLVTCLAGLPSPVLAYTLYIAKSIHALIAGLAICSSSGLSIRATR